MSAPHCLVCAAMAAQSMTVELAMTVGLATGVLLGKGRVAEVDRPRYRLCGKHTEMMLGTSDGIRTTKSERS